MKAFSLQTGSHTVALYTNEDKLINSIIPFFAEGLKNDNRCVYGASTETIKKVKEGLQKHDIDVDKYIDNKQLLLFDDKSPFLKDGKFDAEYLVGVHDNLVKTSLEEGYPHIIATVEMSWLIDGIENGYEQILKYEALSNKLFNDTDKVHAICQYNNSKLNGSQIVEMMKIHPSCLLDETISNNPYFTNPKPEDY